jgi:hypothetical protein
MMIRESFSPSNTLFLVGFKLFRCEMDLRKNATIPAIVKGSIALKDRRVHDRIGDFGIGNPQVQAVSLLQQDFAV